MQPLCLPTSVSCPAQGLSAVTLVLLRSHPVGGTGWHRDGAGSDNRQQEGPAHLPAPSVSCFTAGFQSSGVGGCSASAELLLQWYRSHGLSQTSVAATSTKSALHNRFALGNPCFSLLSWFFLCARNLFTDLIVLLSDNLCTALPACVCESLITSLLDKQDGERINIAWLLTVPAVLSVLCCADAAPQHWAGAPEVQVTMSLGPQVGVGFTAWWQFSHSPPHAVSTALPHCLCTPVTVQGRWLIIKPLSVSKFSQLQRMCCCSPSAEEALRSSRGSSARATGDPACLCHGSWGTPRVPWQRICY